MTSLTDNSQQGWVTALSDALAERKARMAECPVRKARSGIYDECPKCGATSSGPCWLNAEADAAVVDAVKEVVADALPPAPGEGE